MKHAVSGRKAAATGSAESEVPEKGPDAVGRLLLLVDLARLSGQA